MDTHLVFCLIALAALAAGCGCTTGTAAASDPTASKPSRAQYARRAHEQYANRNAAGQRPNIILILGDDMGYNDISFHGSNQIPTPNIDALIAHGIPLARHYTAPMCTPTRTSLLTGRYPSTIGMQHFVIGIPEPWGLGLDQKILPEYLSEVGYETHLVGKWHAGFYTARETPTARGYKSFFGCYGGAIDYYNHSADSLVPGMSNGFDIRDQWDVAYESLGQYSTDLFTDVALERVNQHVRNNVTAPLFLQITYNAPHAGNPGDPLQAPEELVKEFAYIKDLERRKYAAMVTSLDRNVGRVITGLDEAGLLDNSVVLWFADNGSPIQGLFANSGSNFPQRGQKNSPWDGAAHNSAGIWSPLLQKKERVSRDLIHVSDWLPTLAHIANANIDRKLDGYNQWDTLSLGTPNPRTNVLVNVDQLQPYTSYVSGKYKYIIGTTANGTFDGWLSNYHNRNEVYPDYDFAQAINDSPTAQALKRFSSSPDTGLAADQLTAMRAETTLTCPSASEPKDPTRQCRPLEGPCLFDIVHDPCEHENLANDLPGVLARLKAEASYYEKNAAEPRNQPVDPRSDPALFSYVWTRWYDLIGPRTDGLGTVLPDMNTM